MKPNTSLKDQGLQRERTQLSWTRSSLVVITGGLMLIKLGIFSLLQLMLVVLFFIGFLHQMTKRKKELVSRWQVYSRQVMVRHLIFSFTLALSALWVCIH